MLTAWLNWGFSLIFAPLLAREIATRMRGVDYRALAAASLLGLGSVWAQGLSGSAALQMATPSALPTAIREIVAHGGVIPGGVVGFSHTIFLWQSLVSVGIEIVVVTVVMWLATPIGEHARDAQALGIELPREAPETLETAEEKTATGGERLERSPLLSLAIVAMGAAYLTMLFGSGKGLGAFSLNTINLALLVLGILLHRSPARLMRAMKEATPATWGVLLQFPFYAGIAGIITSTKLNERIAAVFVNLSTRETFPAVMSAYSALLGVVVPSGGGKWIIEAPYVMRAAHDLHAHIGWVVASYDLGEAVANLVQPFWMIPVLTLLGLRARDVMGYTFLVFLILFPLVLLMTTLLGMTLGYPL
jgi:short-chain fatty acids transporter